MKKVIRVECSSVINAPAQLLYNIVSDYQIGHPAILPKQYFAPLVVEKGGQGAGTVLHGAVKLFGTEYPFHQLVSEPEPGRVILETDIETGQWTTFTFEPLNNGTQTSVVITSEFPPTPGFMGWLEQWTKPMIIRAIYQAELKQFAEYVHSLGVSGFFSVR